MPEWLWFAPTLPSCSCICLASLIKPSLTFPQSGNLIETTGVENKISGFIIYVIRIIALCTSPVGKLIVKVPLEDDLSDPKFSTQTAGSPEAESL